TCALPICPSPWGGRRRRSRRNSSSSAFSARASAPTGCNRAQTMPREPGSLRDEGHHDDKLRHWWYRRGPAEQDEGPRRHPEPDGEEKTKPPHTTTSLDFVRIGHRKTPRPCWTEAF